MMMMIAVPKYFPYSSSVYTRIPECIIVMMMMMIQYVCNLISLGINVMMMMMMMMMVVVMILII